MKILLTGSTGLIGSRFEELMFEKHEITPLSSSKGVDITSKDAINSFLNNKSIDVVIHLAGKTDVDGCEKDKQEDLRTLNASEGDIVNLDVSSIDEKLWVGSKSAIGINTVGTKNLYEVAKSKNMKFIYISSDFIFSGEEESYSEDSKPSPVDWYGMSKYLGEKIIDSYDLVVRISFPYGYRSPIKADIVWKLYDFLSSRDEVSLISDQVITPTFIDDIVFGLDVLLEKRVSGIMHLTGSTSLSPKKIGESISEAFSLDTRINSSELSHVYEGKAPRPKRSVMNNDKIKGLGFMPKTFDEGLALIVPR